MLGLLYNGTIDGLAFPLALTMERLEDFSFAFSIEEQENVFLTHRGVSIPTGDIFNAFSRSVWRAMLAVFLASVLVIITYRLAFSNSEVTENLWSLLSLMTNQFHGDTQLNSSISILFGSLGILFLIFFSLYQSSLLKTMTRKRETVPFHGSRDLAPLIRSRQKYMIKRYADSAFFISLKTSNVEAEKELNEALKINPLIEERNYTRFLKTLASDPKAVTFTNMFDALEIKSKFCHLRYLPDRDGAYKQLAYIFRKDFQHISQFSEAVVHNQLQFEYLYTTYVKWAMKTSQKICAMGSQTTERAGDSLTIFSFSSLIWITMGGLGAAVVAFSIEIFIKWEQRKPLWDAMFFKLQSGTRRQLCQKNISLKDDILSASDFRRWGYCCVSQRQTLIF